jgi:GAF domain-containing protein
MIARLKTFAALAADIETNALTRLRLRFISVLGAVTAVLSAVGLLTNILFGGSLGGAVATFITLLAALGLVQVIRTQRLRLAGTLLLMLLVGITVFATASLFMVYLLLATLTLAVAAALANRPMYIVINAIVFARGVIMVLEPSTQGAGDTVIWAAGLETTGLITLLVVSFTSRYFIEQLSQTVTSVRRDAQRTAATAQVAQITASTLDLDTLFNRSVELIRDYFGFYHVQVFMLDARGEFALLTSSTGEVGQQLLARRHRLAVGSTSVIGRVTYFGQPVIAVDTDLDPLHRPNDLLPDTRSEMAVPIFDGERIIGALDVQSTRPRAFAPQDTQVLETLADLLAVAIRNARLFEEKTRANAEQERLIQLADTNVREIQRLNQQLTRSGWSEFVEQQPQSAGITLRDGALHDDSAWSQTLVEAARAARPVAASANGSPGRVAVPVLLRGEVIGAIEVEPDESLLPADVVEVVEAVAQRLAFSLDNARLFEEAQMATVQEQRINTIATHYQSVNSVDDLLRITLTELSETLGARRGAIRLGSAGPADGDTAR